jgi:hypothetical protein
LNPAEEICFLEILGRADVKYLLEEYKEYTDSKQS